MGGLMAPANPPPSDWFQLVGLLHDLGKVLVLFGEPQVRWGVKGRVGGLRDPLFGDNRGGGGGHTGDVCHPPQWAVVGDTFPVGCKVQKSVVFHDSTFHDNPDTRDPRYK